MRIHGVFRQAQVVGNQLAGKPFGQQTNDFLFAFGQCKMRLLVVGVHEWSVAGTKIGHGVGLGNTTFVIGRGEMSHSIPGMAHVWIP